MIYKVPMYYVVKVQEGRAAFGKIVRDVEYLAGPFGKVNEELLNHKKYHESKRHVNNYYIDIATQYIEVEL